MEGKSIDKIFSCSYSLDLLLDKYRGYAQDYETLEQRVQFLEKENFDLKKELTEKQAVTSYLQEQTKFQAQRLDVFIKENKRLQERINYISKQRDENELMQDHERIKLILDS